jgi:hypothetical protein
MDLVRNVKPAIGVVGAPWIVAVAMLVGVSSPGTAQETIPAAAEVTADAAMETPKRLTEASLATVGGATPLSVPATGIGPASSTGSSWFALGASVGAVVAAAAAVRERCIHRSSAPRKPC